MTSDLPDTLRARHAYYLERAAEAEQMALAASDDMARATYRRIAEGWLHLASQIGRGL